jgi:molybdate transport system substrate-binding protein
MLRTLIPALVASSILQTSAVPTVARGSLFVARKIEPRATSSEQRQASVVTVSAAVSLTESLETIARLYEASGGRVSLNLGASNVLSRQIVNGAPVDLFISADEAQMAIVEKAGMVAGGSRVALLRNQLAIVVSQDRGASVTSAAALATDAVKRIAIGDPEAVPAGVYARIYLQRTGLLDKLRPKLLPSSSVRAALAAVESGGADAGIVYVTDVRASKRVRVAAVISGPDAPDIVYPACVIQSSAKRDAASAFLRFLQSAEAGRVFERFGFQPVGSGR